MTAQTNCLNMSGVVFRMKHEPRFFIEMNVTGSKHPRRQEKVKFSSEYPHPSKIRAQQTNYLSKLRPCLHGRRVTLVEGLPL